jgi:hypothetical protein
MQNPKGFRPQPLRCYNSIFGFAWFVILGFLFALSL